MSWNDATFHNITGIGVMNISGKTHFTGDVIFSGAELIGFTGTTGATGIRGDTGLRGPTGLQGVQGILGDTGPRGASGQQGIQGIPGSNGPTGQQGMTGSIGPTGQQGIQGSIGPTGAKGSLFYNSGGVITNPKVWVGTTTTSGGSATFNISSAGFTTIYSISADIQQNAVAANQPWAVTTSQSTSSISVSTYYTTYTGLVVVGVTVVGTANPQLYTTATQIQIIVVGI